MQERIRLTPAFGNLPFGLSGMSASLNVRARAQLGEIS